MHIKTRGTVSSSQIEELEQNFSLTLPQDYKDFLMKTDGGRCAMDNNCMICVEDADNELIGVTIFFGTNTKTEAAQIQYWMGQYQDEMPENSVLIGDSTSHGFFVLICSGEDSGVYFWDDSHTFKCTTEDSNTYWLADSFTEFMESQGGIEIVNN